MLWNKMLRRQETNFEIDERRQEQFDGTRKLLTAKGEERDK
jgi:hypothetical protein